MKVVIIRGEQNVGKTTAMNLIYGRLISLGAKDFEPRVKVGGNPFDFKCVLNYTNPRNKHIAIAFYSMGDYPYHIKNALKDYSERCDYLVIACRPSLKEDIVQVVKTNYDSDPRVEEIADITQFHTAAANVAEMFEKLR